MKQSKSDINIIRLFNNEQLEFIFGMLFILLSFFTNSWFKFIVMMIIGMILSFRIIRR